MQITVEIPDALAGQLHLGAKTDLRSLLQAMVEQHVSEGGLNVVQVGEPAKLGTVAAEAPSKVHDSSVKVTRPQRNVLARLRGIYGDMLMSGENAVLVARQTERY